MTEDEIIRQWISEQNINAKHQQDMLQYEEDICRCICVGTHGSGPHLLKTLIKVTNNERKN